MENHKANEFAAGAKPEGAPGPNSAQMQPMMPMGSPITGLNPLGVPPNMAAFNMMGGVPDMHSMPMGLVPNMDFQQKNFNMVPMGLGQMPPMQMMPGQPGMIPPVPVGGVGDEAQAAQDGQQNDNSGSEGANNQAPGKNSRGKKGPPNDAQKAAKRSQEKERNREQKEQAKRQKAEEKQRQKEAEAQLKLQKKQLKVQAKSDPKAAEQLKQLQQQAKGGLIAEPLEDQQQQIAPRVRQPEHQNYQPDQKQMNAQRQNNMQKRQGLPLSGQLALYDQKIMELTQAKQAHANNLEEVGRIHHQLQKCMQDKQAIQMQIQQMQELDSRRQRFGGCKCRGECDKNHQCACHEAGQKCNPSVCGCEGCTNLGEKEEKGQEPNQDRGQGRSQAPNAQIQPRLDDKGLRQGADMATTGAPGESGAAPVDPSKRPPWQQNQAEMMAAAQMNAQAASQQQQHAQAQHAMRLYINKQQQIQQQFQMRQGQQQQPAGANGPNMGNLQIGGITDPKHIAMLQAQFMQQYPNGGIPNMGMLPFQNGVVQQGLNMNNPYLQAAQAAQAAAQIQGNAGLQNGVPNGVHPQIMQQMQLAWQNQQRTMSASEMQPGAPQTARTQENQAMIYNMDPKERVFDENVRKTLKELKQEEKEVCGIRIKMPHLNFSKLQGYESFLQHEKYDKKLEFLQKTIYNTKQIKKTLDIRKFQELQKSSRIKHWDTQPEKIIKQKINIRRIKMRVLRRMQKERKIALDKNKYDCPVYMCNTKYPSETALISHYNSSHADLVNLGLKLRKSKNLRKKEKQEKAANAANKIIIMQDENDKKEEQSGSDSSSDSEESTGEDRTELKAQNDKNSARKTKTSGPSVDIFARKDKLNYDSDMSDLLELEKIELEKRQRVHERRSQRRFKRQNQGSELDNDGLGEDEASYDFSENNEFDNPEGAQKLGLQSIQQLIQKKKDRKNDKMKAKISHQFINQMLIFSLINKNYIKETLQKEYQQNLDQEVSELNQVELPQVSRISEK